MNETTTTATEPLTSRATGGQHGPVRSPRRRLPPGARRALLTAHIVVSVALLGDSAGYLAVAIRTSTVDDPAVVHGLVQTLNMFSLVFGIPLSFAALLSGLGLSLGTKWSVFRYPWVMTKLALIVSVTLVGTFVIGPASNQMLHGGADTTPRLIAAAAYDVVALTVAVALGVFKPGKRVRWGGRDRRWSLRRATARAGESP